MKIQTYILALTLLLVTSCEGDFMPTELEGRWYRFNVLGKRTDFNTYLQLNTGGTGSHKIGSAYLDLCWQLARGTLILEYADHVDRYPYEISYPYLFLSTDTIHKIAYIHQ